VKAIVTTLARLLLSAMGSTLFVVAGAGIPADYGWQQSSLGWHAIVCLVCAWVVCTAMLYGCIASLNGLEVKE